MPVLLTGGGSVLAPDSLTGASELIMPPIPRCRERRGRGVRQSWRDGGYHPEHNEQTLAEATEAAKQMAVVKAVEAGAKKKESVAVANVDVMPIRISRARSAR